MIKLLIIADDFTGALDTGIQFAQMGVSTNVVVDADYDCARAGGGYQVVVVDAETRHMAPEEAYCVVFQMVKRARAAGVELLFKKTDSALRGCIGSELAALAAATGAEVAFVPALPKAGRTTKGGVQYLDGVPIHETVFGRDPFEPVRHAHIPDLLRAQHHVPVRKVGVGELGQYIPGTGPSVTVFDAQSDGDLRAVTARLAATGGLGVVAGCSGLAAVLPEFIEFRRTPPGQLRKNGGLFVVSGSLNPITERQLDFAEADGFLRIHMTPFQKFQQGYFELAEGREFLRELRTHCESGQPVIVDVNSACGIPASDAYAREHRVADIRAAVADRMGEVVRHWLDFGLDHTVLMTGGDTLLGFMKQVGCNRLDPLVEMSQGAVVSLLQLPGRQIQVVSKSGGFGGESVLTDIARALRATGPKAACGKQEP